MREKGDNSLELNRIINVLTTLGMDDIVNETLAVWIYNFNPNQAGHNKASDGRIKTGKRNPIYVDNQLNTGKEPIAQVVSAPLNTEQILDFIDSISDKISNMFGIESVLKQQLNQELSGIALRLKNEPVFPDP